jgi:hypothetical protein
MDYTNYIIIFIILILATLSPLQVFLNGLIGLPSLVFGLLYAIILLGLYIGIKKLVDKLKKQKDDFFFEVAQGKKCSGAYYGKPTSFEYSAVGSGDCEPEKMPDYGMISNYHQCQAIGDAYMYPEGVYENRRN